MREPCERTDEWYGWCWRRANTAIELRLRDVNAVGRLEMHPPTGIVGRLEAEWSGARAQSSFCPKISMFEL